MNNTIKGIIKLITASQLPNPMKLKMYRVLYKLLQKSLLDIDFSKEMDEIEELGKAISGTLPLPEQRPLKDEFRPIDVRKYVENSPNTKRKDWFRLRKEEQEGWGDYITRKHKEEEEKKKQEGENDKEE